MLKGGRGKVKGRNREEEEEEEERKYRVGYNELSKPF